MSAGCKKCWGPDPASDLAGISGCSSGFSSSQCSSNQVQRSAGGREKRCSSGFHLRKSSYQLGIRPPPPLSLCVYVFGCMHTIWTLWLPSKKEAQRTLGKRLRSIPGTPREGEKTLAGGGGVSRYPGAYPAVPRRKQHGHAWSTVGSAHRAVHQSAKTALYHETI